MGSHRLRAALPYFVLLSVAAILYRLAENISFTPRPGHLGPDFWPKLAIGLIAAVSACEAARRLLARSPARDLQDVADALDPAMTPAASEREPASRRSARRLLGGMALTVAYVVLVPVLGFVTASFAFLILFMYLGGFRRHLVVWGAGALGMLAFAFIFLKVVYVSLPRGQWPFDQITQGVMILLGVR